MMILAYAAWIAGLIAACCSLQARAGKSGSDVHDSTFMHLIDTLSSHHRNLMQYTGRELKTNSSTEVLPCGSWFGNQLTDNEGRPFFTETIEATHDFAPQECLAFCASKGDCTAFTARDSRESNCEWTDVAVDSLRKLEHEEDKAVAPQQFDDRYHSGYDYHDYDSGDFAISMVMCSNWTMEEYPRLFEMHVEEHPCGTWLYEYMLIAESDEDIMIEEPMDRERCWQRCTEQSGCTGVMVFDVQYEYRMSMCSILRSARQDTRVVSMQRVRELSPPEDDEDFFMNVNVTSLLICNPSPYIPDQEHYGYNTPEYEHIEHDHPHGHVHVHEDGTTFYYTHSHPHTHEIPQPEHDGGHSSSQYYDPYQYNPGYNHGDPTYGYDHGNASYSYDYGNHNYSYNHGNSSGYNYGSPGYGYDYGNSSYGYDYGNSSYSYNYGNSSYGYNYGNSSYGYDYGNSSYGYNYGNSSYGYNYGNSSYGYDYGNSSYGYDYGNSSYAYDYGNSTADYPSYAYPIMAPEYSLSNCSHIFAENGLPPCNDYQCWKSSVFVDTWITPEEGLAWKGYLTPSFGLNVTAGEEGYTHLAIQDWPSTINGVGIVAIGIWSRPTSVRIYDDKGIMIAGRDFPDNVDGICTDQYWYLGRRSEYPEFTGPCASGNNALLKTTLSQPRSLESLTVVTEGSTMPTNGVKIVAIILY